jgi:hypothetical protein
VEKLAQAAAARTLSVWKDVRLARHAAIPNAKVDFREISRRISI